MINHTVKDEELMPVDWQNGNVAMSKTHFYMIYNDPAKGTTVHWNNRITNESDKRHNFQSRDDAKSWIKDVHYHAMRAKYSALASQYGLSVGQRWAKKKPPQVAIEVTMMDESTIYTKAYDELNADTGYAVENDPLILKDFLSNHFCLMLDGETIEQCLARHEAAA